MGLLQPVQRLHEAVHDSLYAGHSAVAGRRPGTTIALLCPACREGSGKRVGLGRGYGLESIKTLHMGHICSLQGAAWGRGRE